MKKVLAFLSAIVLAAGVVGCGSDADSSSSSSEAATTEATTEVTTKVETEEETEAETEEVDLDALAAELTQEETVDNFTLKVSPDWTKSETQGYPMWYLSDKTGAFFIQQFDAASMGVSLDDHKKALESVGAVMDAQATVVDTEWDTLNGEDAYAVVYTMDVSGITATNTSVFFFVGETICSVTFTDFGGTGMIMNYAQPILDTITFNPESSKVTSEVTEATEATETTTATQEMTMGQKNALSKAKDYLEYSAFSYSGLIEQLEFEGFSTEDATFAVDRCGADWNEQAAQKAQDYLDYSSFSRDSLIEQLEFEGFTAEQAEYGVTAVGY